jgi:hypothetical protein
MQYVVDCDFFDRSLNSCWTRLKRDELASLCFVLNGLIWPSRIDYSSLLLNARKKKRNFKTNTSLKQG